ncbi:YjgN family protein [Dyella sp. 2HG41-7]|uniref:YjgN family protein n=1 Tax=Dyella sp. 2HG41-7 TaxID=2883239 RepID=UPI001F39C80A|nr:YjgN family protein [Dyella sp. 2HG41-7]
MHDETMGSGIYLPEISDTIIGRSADVHEFEFRGNARDYFRIWIVNVALSIVTLGIYSAWASVRTRRYMYANTLFEGSPFEYLARPIPILRGRLIAAMLFATYVIAGHFSRPLQLATMGVVGVFMPWMVVKGLMFRARYSAWRGLHFRFIADYAGAYQWYLLVYLLMAIPLGLFGLLKSVGHPLAGALLLFAGMFAFYPWVKGNQQQWMAEHHYFGGKSFRFTTEIGAYYRIYGAAFGIALLCMIPTGILMGIFFNGLVKGHIDPKTHPILIVLVSYLCLAPLYITIWTYTHVRMTNALYNQASLARYQMQSSLEFGPMLRIYMGNALAIIFTLGLAIPWAKIQVVRYRASCLRVIGEGNLEEFTQRASDNDVSATGTEIDSLLGFDIGL